MNKIFASFNPWTGEEVSRLEAHSESEIKRCLIRSSGAFLHWRSEQSEYRLGFCEKLAVLLERDRELLSFSMAEEMGKTLTEARAEVDKSITLIRYLQENITEWLEPKSLSSRGRNARMMWQPLGGILLVMPWNFPLWQVCRAALPAICAGNVVILKHAPNVFRFSGMLAKLFAEAGFPEGVFQELRVDIPSLEALVASPSIAAISLTGSELAGRSMAALAGRYLKKCVLELGGSDPFVVLEDADLPAASQLAVVSRMLNNGQSCIAAKRFLVQDSVADEFIQLLIEHIAAYRPGNPCLPETKLGPLARPDLVANLQGQLEGSQKAGAKVLYVMHEQVPESACVFQPVLLDKVVPGMPAFDEETFGPLFSISRFRSAAEAINLANSSRYGLGASVHGRDASRALRFAEQLDCGTVALNQLMRSDPALPFGGVKDSGYGKELSKEGMEEFCNRKVILL